MCVVHRSDPSPIPSAWPQVQRPFVFSFIHFCAIWIFISVYYLYNLYIYKWSKRTLRSGLTSRGLFLSSPIILKGFLTLTIYALVYVYLGNKSANVRISCVVGRWDHLVAWLPSLSASPSTMCNKKGIKVR